MPENQPINLTLPASWVTALDDEAKRNAVTRSDLIRIAIASTYPRVTEEEDE